MNSIVNYHVMDPTNIGDLFSAPANYFSFPGFQLERADIREIRAEDEDKHIILGGGGLLFPRFLDSIVKLLENKRTGKVIAWGVGQQLYSNNSKDELKAFDYAKYVEKFDLIGIRDIDSPHEWVPCASCMHSAFDKKREIKHDFVVFSHKKFEVKVDNFPRMTNEVESFEEVLDFLGSGETVLTSSYHGAYWATLLGRKVLAFPFSTKFYSLKHRPGIYPVDKWREPKMTFSLFGRKLYEFKYGNQFSCQTTGWQNLLKDCTTYPNSLQEARSCNQAFYSKVAELLSSSTNTPPTRF